MKESEEGREGERNKEKYAGKREDGRDRRNREEMLGEGITLRDTISVEM